MSGELKPCPFCGEQHKISDSVDMHFGQCKDITCIDGRVLLAAYSPKELERIIEKWNYRPIENAFRDALEKVSGALRREIELTNSLGADLAIADKRLSEANAKLAVLRDYAITYKHPYVLAVLDGEK